MKTIRSAIPLLLLLLLAPCALCQVGNRNHEAYGDKCPALHSADPATIRVFLSRTQRYVELIDRVVVAAQEMAQDGFFSDEEIARALIDAATGVEPSAPTVCKLSRFGAESLRLTADEAAVAVGTGIARSRLAGLRVG